jgi:CHAT domain-containing protein
VPSKETTELMTSFYKFMSEGKTKAEALRQAKMDLMKKKPNPFYWGAFVLVGNPQ